MQTIESLKLEVGAELYARLSTNITEESRIKYCQYVGGSIVDLMAQVAQLEMELKEVRG